MTPNFESLILKLQEGNTKAFNVIFNAFYNRLFAFSFKYVKDHYAAEEIVENTMLNLWEKRTNLSHIKDLKSYLYQTVRNASINYLKKNKNLITLNTEVHDYQFTQFIIEEETHAHLIKALDSLPSKCRKIFELCCIDGMKYKDIAEDLQISINTVKSQRARAIKILKNQLKNSLYYSSILFYL